MQRFLRPNNLQNLTWTIPCFIRAMRTLFFVHTTSSCLGFASHLNTAVFIPFDRLTNHEKSLRRFDNARSELETFSEIATFLESVAAKKLSSMCDRLLREQRLLDAAAGWTDSATEAKASRKVEVEFGAYGGPRFQRGVSNCNDFESVSQPVSKK